ncbi:MAG: alpha/beta hydrolase [Bacteroidota bacterium]|nr:alpha/beta hydrolase [Bacteroidota bacterium]MDP4232585.1 alpha/beta hydrolase [Bacteroidota bacterium]MDP4242961.1 alpha/beta hydrolase [Bacteroidota bacterium]MDP4286464.1 alpha/beta hydrolase [Bacteroidota bacterium]
MLSSKEYPSERDEQFRVLLLHAFPLSSAMWDAMIAEFQNLRDDTTIVTLDFPGFGEAPREEGWTMAGLANAIEALLSRKGEGNRRIVVAGLSMGGYAALEFYRQFPGSVRGLVLSNTRAAADTEAAKRAREIFAKDALKRRSEAGIERLYPGFVSESTDPKIAIEIRQWMSDGSGEAIADALRAMASRQDSTDLLPLAIVPSLVIASSHDAVIPAEEMRAMAMQLRDSTFIEFDAAHLSAVERPKEWAEALASFLERVT